MLSGLIKLLEEKFLISTVVFFAGQHGDTVMLIYHFCPSVRLFNAGIITKPFHHLGPTSITHFQGQPIQWGR